MVLGRLSRARQVPAPSFDYLKVQFSSDYTLRLGVLPFFLSASANSITRDKVFDEHQRRLRQGLWWNVADSVAMSTKVVVRKWSKRRVRQAFVRALAAAGLDAQGLATDPHGRAGGKALKGTLRLTLNAKTVTMPFESIQADMETLVNFIITKSSSNPVENNPYNGRDPSAAVT